MSGSRKNGSGGGWGVLIVILIVLALIVYGVSAIGHVLGLTPTGSEVLDSPDGFVSKHYEGVPLGYVLTVALLVFIAGVVYLLMRSRAGALDVDANGLLRGLALVGVALVALIIFLPAGERDQPLQPAAGQLASSTAQDREAKQRLRQQAARERRRERQLEQAREQRQRERARQQRQAQLAREQRQEQQQTAPQTAVSNCDPNYSGACLDPNASDYDCQGGEGDGPKYTGPVTVVGSDHYDLDTGDGDPRACEPY